MIEGSCDQRFGAVREAFSANFDAGLEVGASVAVVHRGDLVVDLWGGFRDPAGSVPWTADTITNVWSSTKTMTALCVLMLVDRGEVDVDAPVARYWPEFAAERQGGRPRPAPHVAHRRPVGLAGADGRGRPVRLGEGDGAPGRAGAMVAARQRVRLPRDHPGLPARRGGTPGHGPDPRPVLRQGGRRAARRRLPHRRAAPRPTSASPT